MSNQDKLSEPVLFLEIYEDGLEFLDEIKRSLSPRVSSDFHSACEDVKPVRQFVAYAGKERFPVSHNLEAVNVRQLTEEIILGH